MLLFSVIAGNGVCVCEYWNTYFFAERFVRATQPSFFYLAIKAIINYLSRQTKNWQNYHLIWQYIFFRKYFFPIKKYNSKDCIFCNFFHARADSTSLCVFSKCAVHCSTCSEKKLCCNPFVHKSRKLKHFFSKFCMNFCGESHTREVLRLSNK